MTERTAIETLRRHLAAFYRPEEYPALAHQLERWSVSRPYARVRVLDATPLFRNTLVKHLVLLAAGAELTAATGNGLPGDPAAAQLLAELGVPVAHDLREGKFDIVMDCAGVHRHIEDRFGRVELTRSGAHVYENSGKTVFLADSGRIKLIETALGTGDGFVRAMRKCGYENFAGKSCVLFGFGKVGRGIAARVAAEGAKLTVIDLDPALEIPGNFRFVPFGDRAGVCEALRDAWCVVSATGRRNALNDPALIDALRSSSALVANMGVEDEFGPLLPPERVLYAKKPLNFMLEEPTRIAYIDPTMALVNAGGLELLGNRVGAGGIFPPSAALENYYLDLVRTRGVIAPELAAIDLPSKDQKTGGRNSESGISALSL